MFSRFLNCANGTKSRKTSPHHCHKSHMFLKIQSTGATFNSLQKLWRQWSWDQETSRNKNILQKHPPIRMFFKVVVLKNSQKAQESNRNSVLLGFHFIKRNSVMSVFTAFLWNFLKQLFLRTHSEDYFIQDINMQL